jgi:hypothetical protein
MKFTLTVPLILSLTMAALIVNTSCAHFHTPSTEVCSVSFGVADDAHNLTSTNRIVHQVGVQYGWKLTVHSSKSKVRVKEVFKLPDSAQWTANQSVTNAFQVISDHRSPSGNISVSEYDLEMGRTGYEESELTKTYTVINGDPKGTHKISIYVEGNLIQEITFQVVDE